MKKIFFILFSLIMMCSVSFGIEANKVYSTSKVVTGSSTLISVSIDSLTPNFINNIFISLAEDSTDETALANYQLLTNKCNELGLKYCCYLSGSYYFFLVQHPDVDVDIDFALTTSNFGFVNNTVFDTSTKSVVIYSNLVTGYSSSAINKCYGYFNIGSSSKYNIFNSSGYQVYDANCNVYILTSNYWDGVSYAYQAPEIDDGGSDVEVPELTDKELAELVTRFVNSEAKLSNNGIGYNDYFITYDTLIGYYRAYSYDSGIDLGISYGNYDEEGNFVTSGTTEGEAWQIRPYVFNGNIYKKLNDWLASKFNLPQFCYYSISPDSSIEPRYIGMLEHSYCSNYVENEVVVYTTKQIRFLGEETDEEGNTEVVVTEDFIPKTTLTDSETGEEIIIEETDSSLSDTLFSKIASVIKGGFEGLLTGIKAIFVPSEDFLSDKANQILDKITFYTSLQSTFDNLIASMTKDSEGAPQITVDFDLSEDSIFYGVGSANVLDFSWYEPFKPVVDLFIIAFVYGVFIWRFIKELPNTIAGISEAFEYEPLTVTDSKGEHFAMKQRHTGKIRKGR